MLDHRLSRCACALALCLTLPAATARAERPPRPETRGLGFTLGAGNQYAGMGLRFAYYVPVRNSRLTLTPNAAVGTLGRLYGQGGTVEGVRPVRGVTAGVGASYGYRHRLIGDAGYGLVGAVRFAVQNIVVDAVPLYGAFGHVGYEFVGARGFIFRFSPVGVAYMTSPLAGASERVTWAASLGIGWKLW